MNNQIELLKLKFNDTYKACSINNELSDRKLFVNMVDSLLKACKELETVKSAIIRLAFYKAFEEKVEELEKLEASLKARNMI